MLCKEIVTSDHVIMSL